MSTQNEKTVTTTRKETEPSPPPKKRTAIKRLEPIKTTLNAENKHCFSCEKNLPVHIYGKVF